MKRPCFIEGHLNIGQAAAKFEVNRKTVKHWLDKVELHSQGWTLGREPFYTRESRNGKGWYEETVGITAAKG